MSYDGIQSEKDKGPAVIDFETVAMQKRPNYPPKPVGVAIKYPNAPAVYHAFAHDSENNCTFEDAHAALKDVWMWEGGLLFHNAKFDIDVAEVHFGMPRRHFTAYHDTLLFLFLDDPNQVDLGLKAAAHRLLQMPPEERDAIFDWLKTNKPKDVKEIITQKNSGAYISRAPGSLVSAYAIGDVVRTEGLYKRLYPSVLPLMQEAYDRERELLLHLLDAERQGLPVRLSRLHRDVAVYTRIFDRLSAWIVERLGVPELNIDSGAQLLEALVFAQMVDITKIPKTEKGNYKTSKDVLAEHVQDDEISRALQYRATLGTCLQTFMVPWLEVASKTGGTIFTEWNQVRKGDDSKFSGARTGRLSSSPNFQNMPSHRKSWNLYAFDDPSLPTFPIRNGLRLPNVRSYVGFETQGKVLLWRDYSQQELRILAHFEAGIMHRAYLDDPTLDFHTYAKNLLVSRGWDVPRSIVKGINFGLLYGMGIKTLSHSLALSLDEAKETKAMILRTFPGISKVSNILKNRAYNKLPFFTWGGRRNFCEKPKLPTEEDKRTWTYEYKMLNTLIQGSAADCTKDALNRFFRAKAEHTQFLLTVHDEIVICTAVEHAEEAMHTLKSSMESVQFSIPMLSDGYYSTVSWARKEKYDEK